MYILYTAGKVGKDIEATYGLVIQFYFLFPLIANPLTVAKVSVASEVRGIKYLYIGTMSEPVTSLGMMLEAARVMPGTQKALSSGRALAFGW